MVAHIIVSGRVQGVGFRYHVLLKAAEQDIKGWVRNLDDGTVEIEAEGTKEQLDKFIESLQKGLHRFIKITGIDIQFKEAEKKYTKFEIKY